MTTTAANTVTRTVEGDLLLTGFRGWAVGQRSGGAVLLGWEGTTWTRPGPYPGIPNQDLNGVYCVAEDDCWAVGKKTKNPNRENINHWDGFTWTRVGPYGSVPNQELKDVNCLANGDCWAVGKRSGGENINHWDGATWSRAGPYGSIPNQDLNAVDMVSATEGYVVGKNGTMAVWDGSTWTGQASPVGEDLNSVSVVAEP